MRKLFLPVVASLLLVGCGNSLTCATSTTLESLVTQKFVHIEQDPNFRNPSDWIAAIMSTFP